MATYKSKIGLELVIPITIIIGGTGILMVYEKIWVGLALILILVAFIAHTLLTIYYKVDTNTLQVKCGFFYNRSVIINTIKGIEETSNPISSPAASLDRLLITYNKYDTVIVSPKEKENFINHVTNINPSKKVTLKKSKRAISAF